MHPRAKRAYIAELAEGNRRAARNIDCPKCGAPVLRGDDGDMCALTVTVDVEPIDRVGEMLAVLSGRSTYELTRQTGKTARPGAFELWWRYEEQIHAERDPAGTLHVEHRCTRGKQ